MFTQKRKARKGWLCIGLTSFAPLRENLSGDAVSHLLHCKIGLDRYAHSFPD